MKDNEKYLIKILNKELIYETRIPKNIAAIIARLVLEKKIPLGTKLPTQAKLAGALNVNFKIIEDAWKLLKVIYRIIGTERAGGTRIVSDLNLQNRKKVQELIESPAPVKYMARFDEETIFGLTLEKRGFRPLLKAALLIYEKVPASKLKQKIIDGLIPAFQKLITSRLNYSFYDNEIYYTDDYEQALIYICEVVLASKSEFVMIKPTTAIVENALQKAKFKVTFIGLDALDLDLNDLDTFCKHNQTGIVYIAASAPYPVTFEISVLMWQKLTALQKIYGFVILLDDRYPGLMISSDLFKDILPGGNGSIIYLAPVTLLHPKLSIINILAGPKSIMSKLRKKYLYKTTLIPVAVGHALLNIMQMGELTKYEFKAYSLVKKLVLLAKEELIKSGLFVEAYLNDQQAWFFYLEPTSGTFPDHVYSELAKSHQFIMDPDIYRSAPCFRKGVLISVSSFSNAPQLTRDLKGLINSLQKMIK